VIQVSRLLESVKHPKAQGIGTAIAFALTSGLAIYGSTVPNDARQRSLSFAAPPPVVPVTEAANNVVAAAPAQVVVLDASGATSVVGPHAAGGNRVSTLDPGLDPGSANPGDRMTLTRALQTKLAGAQCYTGPVNGIWSPQSKDAMRRFTTAVNAQLPINEPDHILLSLIESNSTAVCSAIETKPADIPALPVVQSASESSTTHPPAVLDPAAAQAIPSAAAARVTPITVTPIDPPLQVTKPAPRAARTQARPDPRQQVRQQVQAQRPLPSYKPKPAPFAGVARSISKGVQSIERSLASIFN
jgi:hypothetical protein